MQEEYYKDNKRVMDHLKNRRVKEDLSEYINGNYSLFIIFLVLFIGGLIFTILADGGIVLGDSSTIYKIATLITFAEVMVVSLICIFYYKIVLSKEYSFNLKKFISSAFSLFMVMVVMVWFLNNSIIVYLNRVLDVSEPVSYYVKIVNKKVTKGKSEKYYLTITPWKPYNYYIVFQTDISTYYTFSKGDITKIQVKKGYWGFEYFVSRYGLKRVDFNLYPKDYNFALTEEEANKLIEINSSK